MTENLHPRDRRTGRYVHEWGVISDPRSDVLGAEVVECQLCGKVLVYGGKNGVKEFKNTEAARLAGHTFYD